MILAGQPDVLSSDERVHERAPAARASITRNTASESADTSKHAIRPKTKNPTISCGHMPAPPRPDKQPQIKSRNVAAIGK